MNHKKLVKQLKRRTETGRWLKWHKLKTLARKFSLHNAAHEPTRKA